MIQKKYWEVFLFFLVVCVFSLGNLENLCKIYTPLNFDNQALLTWEYSASLHMLPYRDIFYPYGFLNYFKSQDILFSILYFFLTPLLFTAVFLYLKSIFKDNLFSYVSVSFFFLFVVSVTGFETFNRYGILVAASFLISYVFFYCKKFFYKWLFSIGLLIGIVFSFANDQGLYAFALLFAFSIIDKLLKRMQNRFSFYQIIKEIVVFLVGFGIGAIPFFVYLVYKDSFFQFFAYLKSLPELSLYAKTPFFHSVFSIDNIFTLIVLVITIHFLVCKFLFGDKKVTFNTYAQIGIVFTLVLLEQKSIIRSMDKQLTFIGLLLFISLFYELKIMLRKYKIADINVFFFYITIMVIVLVLFRINPLGSLSDPSLHKIKNIISRGNTVTCWENNKKLGPKVYFQVKELIKKSPGFNGGVFSFPSDPLFYILFNQIPPYYPSIYEATPLYAQKNLIDYIKDQKVEYVIYNYKNFSIQDGIPNYIRTPLLHEYILNNFLLKKQIGDFLILRHQQKGEDFFIDKWGDLPSTFKNYLLSVDLKNIPKSEGYHKRKYLSSEGNKIIIIKHSLDELNNYLGKNIVNSKNKFLLFTFKHDGQKKKIYISIKTKNGLNTDVYFNRCETKISCIINLSHLPLFYRNRELRQITAKENNNIANVMILDIANNSRFW